MTYPVDDPPASFTLPPLPEVFDEWFRLAEGGEDAWLSVGVTRIPHHRGFNDANYIDDHASRRSPPRCR